MAVYSTRIPLHTLMLFFAFMILNGISWFCPALSLAADVFLTWEEPAVSDLIAGYKIYYGPASQNYEKSVLAQARTGSTLSDNFAKGTTYYFAVTSYDALGRESDYSPEVSIAIPLTIQTAADQTSTLLPDTGGALPTATSSDSNCASCHTDNPVTCTGCHFPDLCERLNPAVSAPPADTSELTGANTDAASPQSTFVEQPISYVEPDPLVLEAGEVEINHIWHFIPFVLNFSDPVIVAKITSANAPDPATVRIRNISPDGFEIRIQEWDYLDGDHTMETVDYLVMERGTYRLADGTMVTADKFASQDTIMSGSRVFSQPFNTEPVLFTSVVSFAEADTVTVRMKNITVTGFDFLLQEQQKNIQNHASEDIGYIAWEPSRGAIDGIVYEVGLTDSALDHDWYNIIFNESFSQAPVFLADMQTSNGSDTSALGCQGKDEFSVNLRVEEETSQDDETWHVQEVAGYLALAPE